MQRGISIASLIATIGCNLPTEESPTEAVETVEQHGGGTMFALEPQVLTIIGQDGGLASAPYTIQANGSGATHLVQLMWNGDSSNMSSMVPFCPAGICPYGMPPGGGFLLDINNGVVQCMPSLMGVKAATLTGTANNTATSTMNVTCRVGGSGPSFTVPPSLARVSTTVDGMVVTSIPVTNTGSDALSISVALDDNDPDSASWEVLDCEAPSSCGLIAGATIDIDVRFTPSAHGDFDTSVVVSGPPASSTPSVLLLGTGIGGKLSVDDPPAPMFRHDFGVIAKNQLATFDVKMTNIGNADLAVNGDEPGAPFDVDTSPVTIAGSAQGMFEVSCQSASAMSAVTKQIMLTEDAYDQNTQMIEVVCAIANTTVQVTNPLDFEELRVGDPSKDIIVEIENPPGGGPVTIELIELDNAPNALDLVKPNLPMMLADGAMVTATLTLETTADVTLEDVKLKVEVTETDTATLELPVTGKVGTPKAVVLPVALDLGTVCVGTPVEGTFTMTNTGSSTLHLQRPTMESTGFVPLYTNPTDYPTAGAVLRPMDKATVGVMPASGMAGLQTGTVTWNVDAPNAPFETTVTLGLLMEGTAVSPGKLSFGAADVSAPPTMEQMITLENCGPETAMIGYGGVEARLGTVTAWLVDPPTQQRELAPDETMRVRVAFSPTTLGAHEARLPIGVDGSEVIVVLDGEAFGVVPEETSFYACGCSGSADPERGWPILVAFAFVVRRRRRRC